MAALDGWFSVDVALLTQERVCTIWVLTRSISDDVGMAIIINRLVRALFAVSLASFLELALIAAAFGIAYASQEGGLVEGGLGLLLWLVLVFEVLLVWLWPRVVNVLTVRLGLGELDLWWGALAWLSGVPYTLIAVAAWDSHPELVNVALAMQVVLRSVVVAKVAGTGTVHLAGENEDPDLGPVAFDNEPAEEATPRTEVDGASQG